MILPFLYIAPAHSRGRGVFTAEPIPAGVVIEISPVIPMPAADRELLDRTTLHDYIFIWDAPPAACCMALGYVPVYNHSYASNCEYEMDYDADTISIRTVREIREGEELTINYNGDWNDEKPVWFQVN